MSDGQRFRQYMAFATNPGLLAAYREGAAAVTSYLDRLLPAWAASEPHVVEPLPSLRLRSAVQPDAPPYTVPPPVLLVPLLFDDVEKLIEFRTSLAQNLPDSYLGMGADIPALTADYRGHWCPNEAADPIFGRRTAASDLINADYLGQQGLRGQNVNVAIVDQGVDSRLIPAANFGVGWPIGTTVPGAARGGHGAMIVRNVLAIAGDALIFDCPVIPRPPSGVPAPRPVNLPVFLSNVEAAYRRMLTDIAQWRANGQHLGPWIFVNAWAIFDRRSENPIGNYTENPLHIFNVLVDQTADQGFDFVFGAGNCGQFCPDRSCGATDRGPGKSIWGANSHPSVLTLGAVRCDGAWLGYSSQGPGQGNLEYEKPDLCAPSQFAEDHDAYLRNTGSSAATGIAAGVVAALRGRWDASRFSPNRLKRLLIQTARRAPGPWWNARLGNGILDAKAAYDRAIILRP